MELLVGTLIKVLLFAFIAGMFTLVFIMARRGRRQSERIRAEYAQLARIAPERGWTYTPYVRGKIDQFSGVGPFPKGQNLPAWHYTAGEIRGHSFKYFEYREKNIVPDGEVTERPDIIIESVFVVTTPGSAPYMEIYHPGMLDTMMDRRTKVQLGVPKFDLEFRIASRDEPFARSVLSGDLIPFLLTDPRAKKSRIALRDDAVFTWYTGTMSPQAADEKLNYLCDVLERIPAQAWTTT
ncbi:hypothetical protein [Streptomyces sp. Ru72]|uniref:hypothetical protein n=1 Tax=Streptomyces sp. Ru72 TaxID=2080747 RepID=UPI000CDD70A2|nr:hypothetical protein [Streptomyces sp. Ru72]POX45953.1 hypothetical protein C3488_27940 [Streptomyces sp. Ru72]